MLQTNILFVDETNNDRSLLAEAYFNQAHGDAVRAFSAGFSPDDVLDDQIFQLLLDEGIAPDDYCPKPLDIFRQPYSPRIDLIVGFQPMMQSRKMPMFPNHPSLLSLMVDPIEPKAVGTGRKRATRTCYVDLQLAIDRARAKGDLPNPLAA